MVRIATNDAQSNLAELVLRASRGEIILLTDHGQPVAKLIAADAGTGESTHLDEILLALRDIRSRSKLPSEQTLKNLITEGRKY